MTVLTERIYAGEFLISEATRHRSRDQIVVGASQTLKAGAVIGLVDIGALTGVAAAKAGNTGNGVMGAVTVAAGTPAGVYNLEIIEPAANAGIFRVEDGGGVEIGHGAVAAAFALGGLGFTLADGATDFVAGDGFTITVTDAAATDEGHYKGVATAATDGSAAARGILFDAVTTGVGATAKAVAITRDAEINRDLLDFGALDGGHIITAIAQLAALGIIVR